MPTAEDAVSPRPLQYEHLITSTVPHPKLETNLLPQDLDSDDQSWSISTRPSINMTIPCPTTATASTKPTTRASIPNTSTVTSTRWSSRPKNKPQEYQPTPTDKRRKTHNLTDESTTTTSFSYVLVSALQNPQGRNAAKRAAHNIIEKRYRTNMNAKFLTLEEAISPAGVQKYSRASAGAGSLKKSEILSNALAYRAHSAGEFGYAKRAGYAEAGACSQGHVEDSETWSLVGVILVGLSSFAPHQRPPDPRLQLHV